MYMKPKIDNTGVEGQLPLSTLNFFVLQELKRTEHMGVHVSEGILYKNGFFRAIFQWDV